MRGIRARSGFSAMEVFRKYLWYVLRERKFDEEAVDDLAALRAALSMSDEEVRLLWPNLLRNMLTHACFPCLCAVSYTSDSWYNKREIIH